MGSGALARGFRRTCVFAGLLLACACGSDAVRVATPWQMTLDLTFADLSHGPGAVVATAANSGTETITAAVASVGGARILEGHGYPSGGALRFPEFKEGQAAVLFVRDVGVAEGLNPGHRSFRFGADFALDPVSSGDRGDNGDNLMQRGLFAGSAQFKLQLDHGIPSCRVAGAAGTAYVKAARPVIPRVWYRAECLRQGRGLSLVLRRLTSDGGARVLDRVHVEEPTGSVRFAPDVPLSVGGKVTASGAAIASESDQFNGLVTRVQLQIRG